VLRINPPYTQPPILLFAIITTTTYHHDSSSYSSSPRPLAASNPSKTRLKTPQPPRRTILNTPGVITPHREKTPRKRPNNLTAQNAQPLPFCFFLFFPRAASDCPGGEGGAESCATQHYSTDWV